MTLDEIRQSISNNTLKAPEKITQIASGILNDNVNIPRPFQILCGSSPRLASLCDNAWGMFFNDTLNYLRSLPPEELMEAKQGFQFGSAHWDWFTKTLSFNSESYLWFYLIIDDRVQGICLICHPAGAKLKPGEIFYIEFIASAPWNTKNPLEPKRFSGIGTTLIQYMIEYSVNTLKLQYGLNLHALRQAEPFYEQKLGMTHLPDYDKTQDNGAVLKFYELEEQVAKALVTS
ncbi:hypothetical protein H8792_011770 [Thiomicrorhabdus sp. HH1]|uniref:N-acetyltransferase domain-containing protein n=2 Tax=Thiomicrorhabdus heinhorstiae TaxID=2748010 RepID=A0ABS0BZ00_9GAMM|nr:hypothetical protein [Thiomicrorhabdus heinhorstiae]